MISSRSTMSTDAVDATELCDVPTRLPVPEGFCEDGNSMVATAEFPFDGSCSIPDAMAGQCRASGYTVEDLATEGQSICKSADGDNAPEGPDMNERVCAVLLEGTWLPKSCGQWEGEISFVGVTGLATICASDPSGGTKGYVDAALAACCPTGTVLLT